MENHPIPQDVTGFQFKLIGTMTIKQFAYVACGVIISVILYYSPLNIIFKIFLIPIFGLSGFALAFLPVEGRPLDVMFFNFIHALFAPNQFVYQKTGGSFSFAQVSYAKAPFVKQQAPMTSGAEKNRQLQILTRASGSPKKNSLDDNEAHYLTSLFTSSTTPLPAHSATPEIPSPQLQPVVLQSPLPPKPAFQDKEIVKPAVPTPPPAMITPTTPAPLQTQSSQKPATKQSDLPSVPDTPNVIVGIVKDPRGNVLPNILVEVKDKNGNPVRAFKTNPLGQFASATPLAPGSYTVVLDDPKKQNAFSVIQLLADNKILLPLEVVSHDAREELRKELFN